jgi:hypothetical protein
VVGQGVHTAARVYTSPTVTRCALPIEVTSLTTVCWARLVSVIVGEQVVADNLTFYLRTEA